VVQSHAKLRPLLARNISGTNFEQPLPALGFPLRACEAAMKPELKIFKIGVELPRAGLIGISAAIFRNKRAENLCTAAARGQRTDDCPRHCPAHQLAAVTDVTPDLVTIKLRGQS
jgi:hypothetical protein